MRSVRATLLLVGSLAGSALGVRADPEAPKQLGLKESVSIDLVQIEVTVWPKTPGSDACLGLTSDDFELLVDGAPRPIYAVDPIGSDEEAYSPDAAPAIRPAGEGMSLVLFFDLWHLDLFYRGFDACPQTKPIAFEEARRLVREQFEPGDRLLLVTFAGWPVVHYGWIRTSGEALAALDRLEKNRQVLAPRQEHLHHKEWIAGIESLLLALGRYPGRKDVIYLGDDFRFDDVAIRMYEIAGRAQVNGVVVSAVDLLASCRAIPGPGPSPTCPRDGGLACSEFRFPVALNPISRDTGGELFRHERIGEAVRELRSVRRCRYLVSFRRAAPERRRLPSVTLRLRADRTDVALHAPSSFETAKEAPSPRDKDEALFLLPRFGRGIGAEVGLWPYRPAGKRWKALLVARVERTDDESWPDDLHEIRVNVLAHRQSHIYGSYRKTIRGADLEELRTTARERLLVLPVDKIRPGEVTAEVTVTADAEGISANVRKDFTVPTPPGPGEARPWFLSDRVVRLGEAVLRAPSLDDTVSGGEPASIMAYACRPREGASLSYTGQLAPLTGGAGLPLTLRWIDPPRYPSDGCGWLVGAIPSSLPSGLWRFEPPPALGGGRDAPDLEFTVVSSTPPAASPADFTPK